MSKLLVKPQAPDAEGRIHEVTPETAGWEHVGFAVHRLADGQSLSRETGDREHCLVLLSGKVAARAGAEDFGVIGGRSSPFESDPWSLYVPAGSNWSVTAQGPCELAICSAPGRAGARPARVIAPSDVGCLTRGGGQQHPPCPQHPAGDGSRRRAARRRGDHTVWLLVELSAAQA
jgi:5-deoxy-glucuronate isomerase